MIVVDASVFVSALVPTDRYHAASRAWLEAELRQGEGIVAPLVLLVEVGAAIARRTSDAAVGMAAVAQVESLPRLQLLPVGIQLARLATELATELKLRAADALYVAVAAHLAVPLLSWDEEHHQRAGQRIWVRYPSELTGP